MKFVITICILTTAGVSFAQKTDRRNPGTLTKAGQGHPCLVDGSDVKNRGPLTAAATGLAEGLELGFGIATAELLQKQTPP